jgi:hypothetical protein
LDKGFRKVLDYEEIDDENKVKHVVTILKGHATCYGGMNYKLTKIQR